MNHADQVLALLKKQIGNDNEVEDIAKTAKEVTTKWVNPLSGGKEATNGLVYGLVQSGKTGVLSVTGAMGADEGYRTVIILTSDNDALYDQTLTRVTEAFPGMDIMGKKDFKDRDSFLKRIKVNACAIIATKNASHLNTLIENFKHGNLKGLTCLLIDDEADQASLNTLEAKANGQKSGINKLISELRTFFDKTTYLQVTATPQGLFLQDPNHPFRPKFTVLSHPGKDYVGGDYFFADNSKLIREFDLNDIAVLTPGPQPSPTLSLPKSLVKALDTFMVGATYKRKKDADQNCAFLCHVSTRKADHKHFVELLRKYKDDLAGDLRAKNGKTIARLKLAYDDLAATHTGLAATSFNDLVDAVTFFSPGIAVKLVNGETDEDVAVTSPYNLFVGGNKLGRGVTIKNLLVSYYGRNPKKPQADTVLQHARMYGYRRKDIGLLRLFLPPNLHTIFRAIHKMEKGLRDLIARNPNEAFRGLYIEGGLNATRKNILAPGAIGTYTGGSNYNPSQMVRDASVKGSTTTLDNKLSNVTNKSHGKFSIDEIADIIELTRPDKALAEGVWDTAAVAESVKQWAKLAGKTDGLIWVDRDRAIDATRRETAGILSGGEVGSVPTDKLVIFMLRMKGGQGKEAVWWPQVRFPDGNYAFAFAI